jgi:hypothetical protein
MNKKTLTQTRIVALARTATFVVIAALLLVAMLAPNGIALANWAIGGGY